MSDYEAAYEERFVRNLRRYISIRQNIKRRVERVLSNPYQKPKTLLISMESSICVAVEAPGLIETSASFL